MNKINLNFLSKLIISNYSENVCQDNLKYLCIKLFRSFNFLKMSLFAHFLSFCLKKFFRTFKKNSYTKSKFYVSFKIGLQITLFFQTTFLLLVSFAVAFQILLDYDSIDITLFSETRSFK